MMYGVPSVRVVIRQGRVYDGDDLCAWHSGRWGGRRHDRGLCLRLWMDCDTCDHAIRWAVPLKQEVSVYLETALPRGPIRAQRKGATT